MIAVDVAQEAGQRTSSIICTKEVDANFWELLDYALEGRHFANDLSKSTSRSQPRRKGSHHRGKERWKES
jgi:hypothetical protein